MLKIYVCETQIQAATVIAREGADKLVDTGANPTVDALIVDRDATGAEKLIRNYTAQSKHILVFKL
jgi:hypothetical protein